MEWRTRSNSKPLGGGTVVSGLGRSAPKFLSSTEAKLFCYEKPVMSAGNNPPPDLHERPRLVEHNLRVWHSAQSHRGCEFWLAPGETPAPAGWHSRNLALGEIKYSDFNLWASATTSPASWPTKPGNRERRWRRGINYLWEEQHEGDHLHKEDFGSRAIGCMGQGTSS